MFDKLRVLQRRPRSNPARFGKGVAVASLGATLTKLGDRVFGEGLGAEVVGALGMSILGIGVAVIAASFLVIRVSTYYELWHIARVEEDVKKWRPSEVQGGGGVMIHQLSVLQTFCPEKSFFSALEAALIRSDKLFSIRFLLMDPAAPILDARMLCRGETATWARHGIQSTVDQVKLLKERVESHWLSRGHARTLDVQIRFYSACPFGPIFILGKYALWAGFYVSHDTSDSAPMIRLSDPEAVDWLTLERSFEQMWMDPSTRVSDVSMMTEQDRDAAPASDGL